MGFTATCTALRRHTVKPIHFQAILLTPKMRIEKRSSRIESMEKATAAVRLGAYGIARKRCKLRVARLFVRSYGERVV